MQKSKFSFGDAYRFFPSPPTSLRALYQRNKGYEIDNEDYETVLKDVCVDTVWLSKDMHVDIVGLLSNQGMRRDYLVNKYGHHFPANYLKDKYVVLLCTPVPIPKNHPSVERCRSIITACSHCAPNVKIVIAAKMSRKWNREDVFYHFLSGFPDDTLAIPFSDVKSRDRLFYSVYWISRSPFCALVVDPQGLVLRTDEGYNFVSYGSEFFPFTNEHLDELKKKDLTLRLKLDPIYKETKKYLYRSILSDAEQLCSGPRPSLASLLGVEYLYLIDNSRHRIQVSSLRKKVVGIYLFKDGLSLDAFHRFQQRCLKCDPDFQMVLVCLDFAEDQSSFSFHIERALKKRSISSWWVCFPNDKTIRQFIRLFGFCFCDELLIVPPDGKSAELQGKSVSQIPYFDDPSYYPFTRETILNQRLSKLQLHTIESLLKDFTHLARGNMENIKRDYSDVPVAHLKGKKIILYLDWFPPKFDADLKTVNMLRHHYSDIQREHRNSEVVFLPMGSCEGAPEMPWLMLPSPSDYVTDVLFRDMSYICWQDGASLLAFGEDGRILSTVSVENYLFEGDIASLFNDNLRKELVADLADIESR